MKNLNEVCMIHSMKAPGLSISKIASLAGCDRKTVRKYLATTYEMTARSHGQCQWLEKDSSRIGLLDGSSPFLPS